MNYVGYRTSGGSVALIRTTVTSPSWGFTYVDSDLELLDSHRNNQAFVSPNRTETINRAGQCRKLFECETKNEFINHFWPGRSPKDLPVTKAPTVAKPPMDRHLEIYLSPYSTASMKQEAYENSTVVRQYVSSKQFETITKKLTPNAWKALHEDLHDDFFNAVSNGIGFSKHSGSPAMDVHFQSTRTGRTSMTAPVAPSAAPGSLTSASTPYQLNTQHMVYGQNMQYMTDDGVVAAIASLEAELDHLSNITAARGSKKINKMIKQKRKDLKTIIALFDQRK